MLHGVFVLQSGAIMAPDSKAYEYWSARLIDSGFAYWELLGEANVGFPPLFYALFVTCLAFVRLVAGEDWQFATILLNFAAHISLGMLIVRLAVRVAGAAAGWTSLVLFLGCYDLLQWVSFVLSDATFVLLAFVIFTLAARRILGDAKGWLKVAFPAAAGIVYRPTGIVLVPDLICAFYLSRTQRAALPTKWLTSSLIAGLLGSLGLFFWLVQDPRQWPFQALSGAFGIVADGYAKGEVVSGRFDTYHAPPVVLLDYALISADRFLHFFSPGAAGYSLGHWLVSSAFLLPCYGLAAWLLFSLCRNDTGFDALARRVFIAAAAAVLAYAAFHALVQVDFDWRYRTPILPQLILLAAGGAADLLRRQVST